MRDRIEAYAQSSDNRFVELGMLFRFLLDFWDDTRTRPAENGEQDAPLRDALRSLVRGTTREDDPSFRAIHQDLERIEEEFRSFEFRRP